jgi:Protein of unknown function (DUF3048) N-terminal domain/Protein of unknown function (DUF3048) C-terminal domain
VRNPFARTRTAVATAAVVVLVAAGVVSAVVISTGGSNHKASATAPATTTTVPATTTTTPSKHHHRKRSHKVSPMAPLTGLGASAKVAKQPAVVVKVDNVAAALPQYGINQADVVYEELVEGGLTRLAAVFQSDYPSRVEAVRSGRLTDEGIADDLNHPVLAYSGTNAIFQPQLAAQPVEDVTATSHPNLFIRDNSRAAPHNYYANVAALAATDKPANPPSSKFFSFRKAGTDLKGVGVAPATGLSVPFPAASIQWTWSAKQKLWLRTQDGAADVDATGARLSATNVIVQFIPYVTSAYATGEGLSAPEPIPKGEMTGHGTAWVVSGAAIVKGTWSRSSATATTVFKDAKGKVIKLAPGRTWIELAPTGTSVAVTH